MPRDPESTRVPLLTLWLSLFHGDDILHGGHSWCLHLFLDLFLSIRSWRELCAGLCCRLVLVCLKAYFLPRRLAWQRRTQSAVGLGGILRGFVRDPSVSVIPVPHRIEHCIVPSMRIEAKVLQLFLVGTEGRASPPVIDLMRTHTIGGGNSDDVG